MNCSRFCISLFLRTTLVRSSRIFEFVSKGSKDFIHWITTCSIIAFEESKSWFISYYIIIETLKILPMVKVVKLIRLKMILPTTMTTCWSNDQMISVPHHCKWRGMKDQGRSDWSEIVKMFNRMHAKTRKRFNVCVPMVKRVNILVHCFDVDEPRKRHLEYWIL